MMAEDKNREKLGLLGGTFNPIHNGHVDLGLKVLQAFRLDKILYILSARPPHKKEIPMVPAQTRWEMLCKALAPYPFLHPCDIEMKRPDFSWTYDTIAELKRLHPARTLFYFISGSEGFLNIRIWKNYKTLLKSLSFIVIVRREGDRTRIEELLKEENLLPCFDTGRQSEMPTIYIFSYDSDKLAISSTLIRDRLKRGQGIDEFVAKEVKKIMQEYRLYEN